MKRELMVFENKHCASRIGLCMGLVLLFCCLACMTAMAEVVLQLPSALVEIDDEAFMNDTSITSVVIPDGAVSIGVRAFAGCGNLKRITIPETVTNIGVDAFDGCEGITATAVENSYAWNWCIERKIPVAQLVVDFTDYEFALREDGTCEITGYTGENKELTLPWCNAEGIRVTRIADKAFYDNTNITSVKIPAGVQEIGKEAFYFCDQMKELSLPEGILKIEECAFYSCDLLEEIYIPDSVETMGEYAFGGCGLLRTINYPINWKNTTGYCSPFAASDKLTSFVIPEGVTSIPKNAFCWCDKLVDVQLPDSLISIGDYAFMECAAMLNIELPNSIKTMGRGVFAASGLQSITLPASLESYYKSFSECNNLQHVVLAEGMKRVDSEAFGYCTNLEQIEFPESLIEIGSYAFYECKNLTGDLVIPSSVEVIKSGAFFDCGFDGSITLPNSLTTIGYQAFAFCSFDGTLVIPDSVTSIGSEAFHDCYNLDNLTLSEGMTRIEDGTFAASGFSGNLCIPEGVTSIKDNAFKYCNNLQGVYLSPNVAEIGMDAFPSSITIYGESGSYAETYAAENGIAFSTDPFPGHLADDVWVTLSGRVLLPDGSAASGVSVNLYKGAGGAQVGHAVTNTDGGWSVSRLEPDQNYRIVCHKSGLAFADTMFTVTLNQTAVPDITAMEGDVYLTASVDAIRAESAAGSTDVRVVSSGTWTAKTENDWIVISTQSGASGDTMTVSCSANSGNLRVGLVSLSAGGITKEIPVVQIGETSFRLPDPTIIVPATDGAELPYASLRVEWMSVPDADHYIISLRDLTTNELLLHHERPEDGTGCVAVLPASFFFMGRSYRIAVGAVPPGVDSSDSTVSWCERTFSVPAQELASDATILGRVCEYEYIDEGENLEKNKHPLANVTVDLYRIDETSKTHEGTFTTGVNGEFTFIGCAIDQVYSLELTAAEQAFAPVSEEQLFAVFSRSLSRAQTDMLENSAYVLKTDAGENYTGDVTGVPKLGEGHQAWYEKMISGKPNGLWAEYFQFEDGEKNNIFSDGSMHKTYNAYKRWEYGSDENEIVREINFRWENDTLDKYNALYTTEYDGSGTGLPIRYMFRDNFAARFNGYLQVPQTDNYIFRLTGDDGIRLSLELPYVKNGYEQLRQLGGAKWHNIGYAKDITTSEVMIAENTIMPLDIQYYNKTGVAKLKLEYRTSTDKTWRIVPADWLYIGRRTCLVDDTWIEPAETMEELDARVEGAFSSMADKTIASFVGDIIGNTIEPAIFAEWDDQLFNNVGERFVTTAYQGVAKKGFDIICDFVVEGVLEPEQLTVKEAWKKIVDALPYVKENAGEYGLDTDKLGEDAFDSFMRLLQLIYDHDMNFYNELKVSFENYMLFDQYEQSMSGEAGVGILEAFVKSCPAIEAVNMLSEYLNTIRVERDPNRLRSWIHMSIIENMDAYAGAENHKTFMGTILYRVLLDAVRASHSADATLYNTVNVLPGVSGSIYYLHALDQSKNDHLYTYFNNLYDRTDVDERLLKQLLIDVIDMTSSEYGNLLGSL
ncbi:MAG: leucine-rich repeat protein [Clostridia bacterium]|nr:leucine-rich repeat protein [Clostridia bacterium]